MTASGSKKLYLRFGPKSEIEFYTEYTLNLKKKIWGPYTLGLKFFWFKASLNSDCLFKLKGDTYDFQFGLFPNLLKGLKIQ